MADKGTRKENVNGLNEKKVVVSGGQGKTSNIVQAQESFTASQYYPTFQRSFRRIRIAHPAG
ncbi:hypothetical protein H5P28_19130 [Ruficoccus amylovorans]|uniref:Uncharacterized protein n=1 Tax=Ruficoccus amylovorans TaxID=1804625 RepID=A0A842HLP6_9BACT|nr:hypothetical protein [Ruficoccus amylovorans]MBC2596387.1 hypothetical protein [Ruficoccus amylovorans]